MKERQIYSRILVEDSTVRTFVVRFRESGAKRDRMLAVDAKDWKDAYQILHRSYNGAVEIKHVADHYPNFYYSIDPLPELDPRVGLGRIVD